MAQVSSENVAGPPVLVTSQVPTDVPSDPSMQPSMMTSMTPPLDSAET